MADEREISSIFIGGGTPSLFSPESIALLLEGVKQRCNLSQSAEITLEANPGTVESEKFKGFKQAGVNRISIGVQSFQQQHLKVLGRIHNSQQAEQAASYAQQAVLKSFNLDLMHGLPQQSVENALQDLHTAIAQSPPHLSWYQLTLEPNTPFYSRPPELPDDDLLGEIQEQGHALLKANGYHQYEISGYSKENHQCQHNLNYWRFGDYLGIGCGAHGKITHSEQGVIERTVKVKSPKAYMQIGRNPLLSKEKIDPANLPFEFFMNRLRLLEPCPQNEFEAYTGLPINKEVKAFITSGTDKGLLTTNKNAWQVTDTGRRYLNSLLELLV
jgi:oxygen-independent coproporphyrinogen-3 oxidase